MINLDITTSDLESFPALYHAFGTRNSGISNSVFKRIASGENPSNVVSRAKVLTHIIAPRQVHGDNVFVVTNRVNMDSPPCVEADGLITARPDVGLAIITADCLPVFIYSPNKRVVGAFHAGWRGTVSKIVLRGMQVMCSTFGVKPEDIFAVLGPCIGSCCLEVGPQVSDIISQAGMEESIEYRAGSYYFDLADANRSQLRSAGCLEISSSALCTKCREDVFYSYRREGKTAGRMVNIISLSSTKV